MKFISMRSKQNQYEHQRQMHGNNKTWGTDLMPANMQKTMNVTMLWLRISISTSYGLSGT